VLSGRPPGVVGLGMHRSGTSALANLLGDLGLRLPLDQMEPNDDNPEGFGESVAVEGFDDELLAAAGASWHCAPAPEARAPLGDELLVAGRAAFRTAFGGPPSQPGWVLKDPRLTLLVPEWRQVLAGSGLNALVLFRSPSLVLGSLASPRRAHTLLANPQLGLAIWERSYRQLLCDLTGADKVLFTDFDALLVDADYRASWAAQLAGFLEGVAPVSAERARLALDARISASKTTARSRPIELSVPQRELYARLSWAASSFAPTCQLPPSETRGTERLFAAHRSCPPDLDCEHLQGY
jgi:hypothetical protein